MARLHHRPLHPPGPQRLRRSTPPESEALKHPKPHGLQLLLEIRQPYTGEPYGIFVAVWHLIRDKLITNQEEADYWENRAWFEANLPVPPYYAEGNPQRAITWFKQSTTVQPLLERLSFYQILAASYGLEILTESTDTPGTIIYQDEFQIAAIRHPSL